MVADNLDVAGVSLASPLEEAARAILSERLGEVRRRVKQCRADGVERAERVHTLRSSIRKAVAAIELFAPALDADRAREMREELERVRKSAGHVRDCDVLMGLLGEIGREAGGDDADTASDEARTMAGRRAQMCQKLRKRCQKAPSFKLRALLRDDAPCGLTLDLAAASAEAELRRTTEESMDKDLHDPACLHEVRIHLRQMRYTLELSHPGDPRIADIKSALNVLGEVADLTTLIDRLTEECQERKPKDRAALESLLACCKSKREDCERAGRAKLAEQPWLPDDGRRDSHAIETRSHQLAGGVSAA